MAVDRRASQRVEQQALFDDERRQPGYEHPPMSGRQLLPENYLRRSDVVIHSSWSPHHPMDNPTHPTDSANLGHEDNWATTGVHYGSEMAAAERREEGYLHPARILHNAVADNPAHAAYSLDFNRSTANRDLVGRDEVWWDDDANRAGGAPQAALDAGKAIPYGNLFEDSGSIGYRVPDAAKRTWEQDVAAANRPEFNRLVGGRNLIGRNKIRDDVDMDVAAWGDAEHHQRTLFGAMKETPLGDSRPELQPGQFKTNPEYGTAWRLRGDTKTAKDMTPWNSLARHDEED